MSEPTPQGISVPLSWVVSDDLPINYVNQFIGQAPAREEIILTFGHVVPPAIVGVTEEERRAQVEALSFVPVIATGRFAMNRERLEELRGIIDKTLDNHDKLFREEVQP